MENKIKTIVAAGAAAAFMTAAYVTPAETFLAAFAGGLFLIPVGILVYMMQSVEKA